MAGGTARSGRRGGKESEERSGVPGDAAGATPDPEQPDGGGSSTMARSLRLVAACLVALEALAMVVWAVALAVDAVVDRHAQTARGLSLAAVVLAIGLGLAWGARGVAGGRRWARAPVLTWQFLQLPVGGELISSGYWYIGVPLLVVSVVVGVLLLGRAVLPYDS